MFGYNVCSELLDGLVNEEPTNVRQTVYQSRNGDLRTLDTQSSFY